MMMARGKEEEEEDEGMVLANLVAGRGVCQVGESYRRYI